MLAPGSCVGDYEILRHAANGAMSEVYEGRCASRGRAVAVKVLHRDLCFRVDAVTRFLNEARALDGLRNERLIALFATGALPQGPPYMVLEWLPYSLEQRMARAPGPLPRRVAARLTAQAAEGLAALHARGVIHRDVKPANMLLAEEDIGCAELKLADLGLAKVLGDKARAEGPEASAPLALFPLSTGGSDVLGTWAYMAPEQWIRPKGVNDKVDVYALGVLLFQLLTGHLPFTAAQAKDWMAQHVLASPPLERLEGRAPRVLRDLVASMLSKTVTGRPAMREVSTALVALQ